ncbi:MAG: hypothetical protein PHH11_08330 [Methylomonas sp.]|nr:hypothetical protein [Methylomonas sp.]
MEHAGELEDISVFPVLWSRWAFHCVRAEFGVALACAEQFLAATESSAEATWQVSAFQAMGTTLWHLGKPGEARAFLQRGLALCETQPQSSLFEQLGEDSAVASYFFNGMVLWLLGLPDQARESVYRAMFLAEALKHPYSKGMALLGAACLHVDRREPQAVIKYSQALGALAAEHGFLLWQVLADILQGWALAASAQPDAGLSLMQRGMTHFLASGANMLQPYFLATNLSRDSQRLSRSW